MGIILPLIIQCIYLFSTMFMNNHMCIIIFILGNQLLIKLVSSQYRLRWFFYRILWIFRGPLPFPWKGARPIAGLKWNIGTCIKHAHVSSRVVTPYIFGIKTPILSLMITFFSSTKFPNFSTSISISFTVNAMSNYAELRVQKSAPWLRPKKKCRYPRCLVGHCQSQGAGFCT